MIFYDRLGVSLYFLTLLVALLIYLIYRATLKSVIHVDQLGLIIKHRGSPKYTIKWEEIKEIKLFGEHYFLHLRINAGSLFYFWFYKFSSLADFNIFIEKVQFYSKLTYQQKIGTEIKRKYLWSLPIFTFLFLSFFIYVQLIINKLLEVDEVIVFIFLPATLFLCAMIGAWLKDGEDPCRAERVDHFLKGKIHQRKYLRFYLFIFINTFILLVAILGLLKSSYTNNLYLLNFFLMGLVFILICFATIFLAVKVFNGQKFIQEKLTFIHKAEFFSGITVIIFLFYICSSLALSNLNIFLDNGPYKIAFSKIKFHSRFNFGNIVIKCYKLADWQQDRTTSYKYCSTFDKIKDEDEVEVIYGAGFLGSRWVQNMRPSWASHLSSFLNHAGKIEDINFSDLSHFVNFNPKKDFKDLLTSLAQNCDNGLKYDCRFRGYLFDIFKDTRSAYNDYHKGCLQKDFLSCLNYLKIYYKINKVITEDILITESYLDILCSEKIESNNIANCSLYRNWKTHP